MLRAALANSQHQLLLVAGVFKDVDGCAIVEFKARAVKPGHYTFGSPRPPEERDEACDELRPVSRGSIALAPPVKLPDSYPTEICEFLLTYARKPPLQLVHNQPDVRLATLDMAIESIPKKVPNSLRV
jgi:hypothetical protein